MQGVSAIQRHLQQAHEQVQFLYYCLILGDALGGYVSMVTCSKHAGAPCTVVTQAMQCQATVQQDVLGCHFQA